MRVNKKYRQKSQKGDAEICVRVEIIFLYLLAAKMLPIHPTVVPVLNQEQRFHHEQWDHWREEDPTFVYVC